MLYFLMMVWPELFFFGLSGNGALAKLSDQSNAFNVAVAVLYAADLCFTNDSLSVLLVFSVDLHPHLPFPRPVLLPVNLP